MKEHGRGFQNMYGTYSFWWFHAELRPSEVGPRFSFFFDKKYTVTKKDTATIFVGMVRKRIASFETHFFRTLFDFGPFRRKLWPWLFSLRFPIVRWSTLFPTTATLPLLIHWNWSRIGRNVPIQRHCRLNAMEWKSCHLDQWRANAWILHQWPEIDSH